MSSRTKIAIVGVGNMGGAVLAGLLKAGHSRADLFAGESRPERCRELEQEYAVTVLAAAEATDRAEIVVVAVKPGDVASVVSALPLRAGQLVVSLAAGIATTVIEDAVPDGVAVVRVMPNTPALVGQGMSVVAGGASASEEDVADAVALMRAVGDVAVVTEKQVDAATAISGSGPAYVFYVAEALIEAGVHLGLPRATSAQLVTQTLVGSSLLLQETGEHPAVLREQVTSPGGTTAAALHVLESAAVRGAFLDATRANRDKAEELGRG